MSQDPLELRREVDAALEEAEVEPANAIWGPRVGSFLFGEVPGDQLRDGGVLAWTDRALTLLSHDNRPSTCEEIEYWVATLTPNDLVEAAQFAITVGLR